MAKIRGAHYSIRDLATDEYISGAKTWNTAERKAKALAKRGHRVIVYWVNAQGQRSDVQRFGNPKRKSTARRKSRARRKRAPNPKALLFKTKAAATAYAKSHGIPKSRYSLKRMKKVR